MTAPISNVRSIRPVETVFGRDLDELSEQVPAFTLGRHIAQARAEMGPERWAALNAEWN